MNMKLIVCLDETLGMAFNNRRQSRDKDVTKKIKELTNGAPLYINPYSSDLIPDGVCGQGDGFYFAEVDLPQGEIDEIYAFYWNRLYPADLKFSIELSDFELLETYDFQGSSHDKITFCHYRRKK